MPRCPRSRTDHIQLHQTPDGWIRTKCPLCEMTGPKAPSIKLAVDLFWLNHNIKNKETTVSTTDYEPLPGDIAYRKGVEEAIAAIRNHINFGTYSASYLNGVFEEQRKKLLTKKVTKYFFLYKPGDRVSKLYDTKELARQASLNNSGEVAEGVFGGITSVTYDETIS